MARGLGAVALSCLLLAAAYGSGCSGGSKGYSSTGGGDDAGDDCGCLLCMGDAASQGLVVKPNGATLVATGPGATQQFQAFAPGSSTPLQAQWTLDSGTIGTIDPTGLFTASGVVGGAVTIEAMAGGLQGKALLNVVLHLSDNPGNVPPSVQQQLEAGGNADPALQWLYPYDATVFPRGLLPPVLQFGGAPPDATFLHVSFGALDYKGFYGPSNPGRVTLTPPLWTTITQTASGTDNVKVEVTKISGGQVSGPIAETWHVAQGSLKGTVYYESRYSSPNDEGATMRIKPGASQPDVLLGGCHVCHYVSADGSTIAAELGDQGPVAPGTPSAAWSLQNGPTLVSQAPGEFYTFGALYKDGSLLLSCGAPPQGAVGWAPDVAGHGGTSASKLYDVKTGATVAAAGFDGVVSYALMPAFSPDGKRLAFNHTETGAGHTLAFMDFDVGTKTFSSLADFANDPNTFLGWPSFTPDGAWVVYENDSRPDYATWSAAFAGNGVDAKADLQVAHLASKTSARLDAVDGLNAGQYYLPFGEQAEGHMNYDPTLLPVAVGGYYWVVFTSRREYGNTINTPDPYYDQDNRTPGTLAWRKKLWVAALDIDNPEHPSTSAHDISHPAFYLDGQDLQTGNYRGFWALDPCQGNGSTCQSGDQCCSGFCRQTTVDGGPVFTCVPPQGCAQEYEKCATDADCCGAASGIHCINGFCAQLAQ
jgi:hypothetical protein